MMKWSCLVLVAPRRPVGPAAPRLWCELGGLQANPGDPCRQGAVASFRDAAAPPLTPVRWVASPP